MVLEIRINSEGYLNMHSINNVLLIFNQNFQLTHLAEKLHTVA